MGRKGGGVGGHGTASQKAIKICDHLFPLLCLIHLSGEWFCPYPPKATNLFSCLSPCIRINLWNSQTCSLFLFTPFSSSVAVSRWLSLLSWFVSFYLSSYSFPQSVIAPVSSRPHLFLTRHLFSPPPSPALPLSVRNVCTNSIQIISRKERATRLCQWQFNPWWARCMQCCACSRKLSDCIWIRADLVAAQLLREENYTERDTWLIFHNVL